MENLCQIDDFYCIAIYSLLALILNSSLTHYSTNLTQMAITPFEYVTVLISIILGMGITKLVSGLATIVQQWNNVKLYWPHLVIIAIVFVIHIQDWWVTYEMATKTYWKLTTFLFVIQYPVILYVLARILFPFRWEGTLIDLKAFYYSNFRKIYFLMMFLPVHSFIENYYIDGYSIGDQLLQIALFPILLFIVLLNKKDEWIHKIIVLLLSAVTIITFIVERKALLIVG